MPVLQSSTHSAVRAGRRLGRGLLDLVLPPRCLACGALVADPGALCADCWQNLAFLGEPACACCGVPFAHDQGLPGDGPGGVRCAACLAAPPAFDRARALWRYDQGSKGLILAFKHADRTDAAPALARWLAQAGAPLLAECDLVAAVPLHWRRLFRRRYNQAALLAVALARGAGKTVAPGLLQRRRDTPSQGHLSRGARERNVAGAFAVAPAWRDRLAGRRVLLVDDVMTTGATVEAAARALTRGGAAGVDVLTLARVVMAPT